MSDSHSTSENVLDISKIAGNASDEIKQLLGDLGAFLGLGTVQFGDAIQSRLRVADISVRKNPVEENKTEAKVVMEIEVREDMLNAGGNLHGGCSALLVDVCSSMALCVMVLSKEEELRMTVSQNLDTVYHSPAEPGDTLRIVNTTLALGARTHSARTEIWNATKNRLVASGTHVKTVPSQQQIVQSKL